MAISTRQELIEGLQTGLQGKTLKSTSLLYLYTLIFLIFLSLPLTMIFGGDWMRQKAPLLVAAFVVAEYIFCWIPHYRWARSKNAENISNDRVSFFQKTVTMPGTVPTATLLLLSLMFFGGLYYTVVSDMLEANIEVKQNSGFTEITFRPVLTTTDTYPESNVFAIIHPKGAKEYYVWRPILRNGIYRVVIRPTDIANIDIALPVEVMFVANPTIRIDPGDILFYWPDGDRRSSIKELRFVQVRPTPTS